MTRRSNVCESKIQNLPPPVCCRLNEEEIAVVVGNPRQARVTNPKSKIAMPIYQAIVLAIVQGLTEFLPISSTAHLVLFPWLLGWKDPGLTFDVALHAGTLVAVLLYFWRYWLDMLRVIL